MPPGYPFPTLALNSIYHQTWRDKMGAFNISAFYKYVVLLQLKRLSPLKRRKNHDTGIRALEPLQILHADTTVFRTGDNMKNYIYRIQDNFSRAILSYKVSRECKALIAFENLRIVHEQYLSKSVPDNCHLITDDGSENLGQVQHFISSSQFPAMQHLIAQRDIEFSNSLIEAANKQLKYRFLYHHHIPDYDSLMKYVESVVQDYNHRPHDSLNGLTPFEVLNGQSYDKVSSKEQILLVQRSRIAENGKAKCCYYGF
jgi:putative transposase